MDDQTRTRILTLGKYLQRQVRQRDTDIRLYEQHAERVREVRQGLVESIEALETQLGDKLPPLPEKE